MQEIFGVYGAGGCGKDVMPLVRLQYPNLDKQCFVFIDDSAALTELNSYKVLSYDDFLQNSAVDKQVVIAIANSKVRELLANKLAKDNILHASVKADNAIVLDDVELGEGSLLCSFVHLLSLNIKIGKFFHANVYSYVGHDCVIGDYVTFAPRVSCNGNIHIHDHAYIGTGAVLKQGTPEKPLIIGAGAIIGMGAVVTKDVLAGTVVVGNPAKPFVK